MPEVDYTRAWFRLKAKITEKRSFGQDELARAINEIELDCLVPESQEGFTDRPAEPGTTSTPAAAVPEDEPDGETDNPTTAQGGRNGSRGDQRARAVA